MATKFEEFLKSSKVDPRRILVASAKIERLHVEDRALKLSRRLARKSEDAPKKKDGEAQKKPRSGRPVTDRALQAALTGKTLSGPAKTRILRAVNAVLEQKKLAKVELSALFDAPKKAAAEG
jgi:hypothetical protein